MLINTFYGPLICTKIHILFNRFSVNTVKENQWAQFKSDLRRDLESKTLNSHSPLPHFPSVKMKKQKREKNILFVRLLFWCSTLQKEADLQRRWPLIPKLLNGPQWPKYHLINHILGAVVSGSCGWTVNGHWAMGGRSPPPQHSRVGCGYFFSPSWGFSWGQNGHTNKH